MKKRIFAGLLALVMSLSGCAGGSIGGNKEAESRSILTESTRSEGLFMFWSSRVAASHPLTERNRSTLAGIYWISMQWRNISAGWMLQRPKNMQTAMGRRGSILSVSDSSLSTPRKSFI